MKKRIMNKNKIRISKFLSYILRHSPRKYGLSLNEHGFVKFENVLKVMRAKFSDLEEEDIKHIISTDPKQRFHLQGCKLRARYGHSFEVQPIGECKRVPAVLFHGTSPNSLPSILKKGLVPAQRKFVHLSMTVDEAKSVGKRKSQNPVILKIDARKASQRGLVFWKEGKVFLARKVAPQYISLYEKR